jgi:hypothetical protein
MKKFLFINTVVALVLSAIFFLSSCDKKDQFNDFDGTALKYEFSVADQVNVNRYEIEISTTGDINGSWTTSGMLLAIQEGLTHDYTLNVDVTDWLKDYSTIYSRIKTVDIDGKVKYSSIQTTYRDK